MLLLGVRFLAYRSLAGLEAAAYFLCRSRSAPRALTEPSPNKSALRAAVHAVPAVMIRATTIRSAAPAHSRPGPSRHRAPSVIIGAPQQFGQPRGGVENAPKLRAAGLAGTVATPTGA